MAGGWNENAKRKLRERTQARGARSQNRANEPKLEGVRSENRANEPKPGDRPTRPARTNPSFRKGTRYEREEVIPLMAHYLGFVRVTDTIREPIQSAITCAIRRGLLGYYGSVIWRED
jgi:hypothetical protein